MRLEIKSHRTKKAGKGSNRRLAGGKYIPTKPKDRPGRDNRKSPLPIFSVTKMASLFSDDSCFLMKITLTFLVFQIYLLNSLTDFGIDEGVIKN